MVIVIKTIKQQRIIAEEIREWEEENGLNLPPTDEEMERMAKEMCGCSC